MINNYIVTKLKQKRSKGIILGTLAAGLSKAIVLLSTLISFYLLSSYLEVDEFGLWVVIITIIKTFGIADIGINNNLVSIISSQNNHENNHSLKVALSNSLFITSIIGIIIGILILFSTAYIDWSNTLGISNQKSKEHLNEMLVIAAISISFTLPFSIVTRVQIGIQESWRMYLWQAIGEIASVMSLLYITKHNLGIMGAIVSSAIIPVLILIFNFFDFFLIRSPQLKPAFKYINTKKIKNIIPGSLLFFVLQILALVGHGIDSIIISNILGPSYVGAYLATERLTMALALTQLFLIPLWPAIGDSLAQGEICWAKKIIRKALYLSVIIGLLSGSIIYFFGNEIIALWTQDNLIPSNVTIAGFAFFSIVTGVAGSIAAFLNNKNLLAKQLHYYLIATVAATLIKIELLEKWQDAGAAIWANNIAYTLFFILPGIFIIYKLPDKTKHYS